jgi:hypothetical protein
VRHVDTGSEVTNLAWSKDSSALVSFLHIKIVSSLVVEILFLFSFMFGTRGEVSEADEICF